MTVATEVIAQQRPGMIVRTDYPPEGERTFSVCCDAAGNVRVTISGDGECVSTRLGSTDETVAVFATLAREFSDRPA